MNFSTPRLPSRSTSGSGRLRRASVASAIAVGLTAASLSATPVSAASPEPSGQAELEARAKRACARVPLLQTRTDNLLARITGDAETRGSLLWLDRRIASAEENDRDEMVEVLTNRRAVREQMVGVLEARQVSLANLSEICDELGA